MLAYVNGGRGSWQSFNITPIPDLEVDAWSAAISPDDKEIIIVVAGQSPSDKSRTTVYQVVIATPSLIAREDGHLEENSLQG